ncbi:hypothetical protein WH47_11731, partial [Habropoda laboriosa]
VIPAERRILEKEETWTLAPEHQDPCPFFEDISEVKPKVHHDVDAQSRITEPSEQSESGTLPRSQETRKSKTKKVKSYLRKCKGALSKGEEPPQDKKRQELCTSWYLDESHQEDTEIVLSEKQSEYLDQRIVEAEEATSLIRDDLEDTLTQTTDSTNLAKEDDRDGIVDETLSRLTEDDQKSDLRRSRTSLYEDARDSMNDRECSVEESKAERNDAVSLETLTTEDTNLNKCDSNDTLIAEVAVNAADNPSLVDAEEGKEEEAVGALSVLGDLDRRYREESNGIGTRKAYESSVLRPFEYKPQTVSVCTTVKQIATEKEAGTLPWLHRGDSQGFDMSVAVFEGETELVRKKDEAMRSRFEE